MIERYHPLTVLGVTLIIVGAILVALPLLAKYTPSLEKLPSILVYVYHRDNFYFVTSPILILISIVSIVIFLIRSIQK